jgi:RNA polymerase primary sigma factor
MESVAPEVTDTGGGLSDEFDLSGWEAEEEQIPPDANSDLAKSAAEIQVAITKHQPVDASTDWEDFDAFLPDRATPLLGTDDTEAREQLRLLLLRAIREGSVPHAAVEDLTRGDDGAPDPDAAAHLCMIVNDLGAETDERFEYSTADESYEVFVEPEETPTEEDQIAETLAFIDSLAERGNEPLLLYQREFQRQALLTAETEVVLGQAMEQGVEKALDVLAAWPDGIHITLEAARLVRKGAKPLHWMSSGSRVELNEIDLDPDVDAASGVALKSSAPESETDDAEDESGAPFDLDAKESISELAEFLSSVDHLSRLPTSASQEAPEWNACRRAIASLRLTRSFLMELADAKVPGGASTAFEFIQAMFAYRRARDRMTVSNLKLVHFIAKKYLFSGQPFDDLLQEGNIGLIKAVDRYDWRRGFRFSTYATWWIRQQIGRSVADKGRLIRLPVHIYEKTQRIGMAARAFELRSGQTPSKEEVAALVDLPVHMVEALSRIGLDPLPIHELPDVDSLIAVHAKDQFATRDPVEAVEDIELSEAVSDLLSTLKFKEQTILRMHFGIGSQDSLTLEEIGARFDVTRERIRQIEAKLLRRLRHHERLDSFVSAKGLVSAKKLELSPETIGYVEAEGDEQVEEVAAPKQKSLELVTPPTERVLGAGSTALDKLLDQVRDSGIVVEDYMEADARRLWVHITTMPDNRSRRIVRKLLALGFEFWPGKGYWR